MVEKYDVIIVGGGPAGLSAALLLGRCLRSVLLCDNGQYRNAYSHALHGFLTRDGMDPAEMRKVAREQLRPYENVKIQEVTIIDAVRQDSEFVLTLENHQRIISRKLLLATGIRDDWPKIQGAEELYGKSIFHCPYCDGWEMKDQPLAAFGRGDKKGGEFALELTLWSRDVILCTNGPSELSDPCRARLTQRGVLIREERIQQLEGKEGILQRIIFEKGEPLVRRAIFFNYPSTQRSDLAARLGCEFDENGGVKVGKFESTNIPGLFAAGDISRDVFQAVVAASEGVEAAMAINTSLLKKDLEA